jgi:phage protein U
MADFLSIGGAKLKLIGLRPTRISTRSEVRVQGTPTFSDIDYQDTGIGERVTTIEAKTLPHVFGGMDAYGILQGHHLARTPVQLVRMGANFLATNQGQVVIRTLDCDEENLHPADGVGREVSVSIELLHVPSLRRTFGGS